MSEMSGEIENAMAKVADLLEDAELLIHHERYTALANGTYYMAFTCLTALFFSQGIFVKTHKGAMAKFGELFIQKGYFDEKYATMLGYLFSKRQEADYDLNCDINSAEALTLLRYAMEFYETTKAFLSSPKPIQP
jgi:uncharacterized protein (UPF0332 family)